MKKIALLLISVMLLANLFSCGIIKGMTNPDKNEETPVVQVTPPDDKPNDPDKLPEDDKDPDEGKTPDDEEDNAHLIEVETIAGLNEQIFLSLSITEGFDYEILYKEASEEEFSSLDKNLMVENEGKLECYIIGIKKGNYDIKIKAENVGKKAIKKYSSIEVGEQDRSGYAHFGATDGVGAYNNDGTLKDGTKIVYVTNDNKNTVSLEINGEVYVGLVNILQAQYKSDTPMLIRVIGKITTNQWNYKNVEPRLTDGSNMTEDFFENTFSTEYGDNLANLIVKMNDKYVGQTFNYKTTPTGLTEVRMTGSSPSITNYKGSDFPSLKGKSVYDDDSYYNMLEVKGSKNITIEGIGADAEIFQFGISFEKCNNIEVKNLTFTDYPEDAINFLGENRQTLGDFNRYWVHNCTFNRGYNAWDITGERDKYAGDGTIDFNCVSSVTLSYNKFNYNKKTMLFGSSDSQGCMDFTMHHNYFFSVESRLPLGRNVNIHSYNNYFSGCTNCSSLRKSSYLFSENNYFQSTSKPFIPDASVVKSFGDIFISSSSNGATIVTSRDQIVSSTCKPDSTTNRSNFDTNSSMFYYDAELGRSDVSIMLNAEDVPAFVNKYAGAGCYNKVIIPE